MVWCAAHRAPDPVLDRADVPTLCDGRRRRVSKPSARQGNLHAARPAATHSPGNQRFAGEMGNQTDDNGSQSQNHDQPGRRPIGDRLALVGLVWAIAARRGEHAIRPALPTVPHRHAYLSRSEVLQRPQDTERQVWPGRAGGKTESWLRNQQRAEPDPAGSPTRCGTSKLAACCGTSELAACCGTSKLAACRGTSKLAARCGTSELACCGRQALAACCGTSELAADILARSIACASARHFMPGG